MYLSISRMCTQSPSELQSVNSYSATAIHSDCLEYQMVPASTCAGCRLNLLGHAYNQAYIVECAERNDFSQTPCYHELLKDKWKRLKTSCLSHKLNADSRPMILFSTKIHRTRPVAQCKLEIHRQQSRNSKYYVSIRIPVRSDFILLLSPVAQ